VGGSLVFPPTDDVPVVPDGGKSARRRTGRAAAAPLPLNRLFSSFLDSGDPIRNSGRRVDLAGQDVYSGTMARWARVVVLGVGRHVTQRGNRRQPTSFQEDGYQAYLDRIEERLGRVVRPAQRGPKPSQAKTRRELRMVSPELFRNSYRGRLCSDLKTEP